ncbi:hypothetical protein M5K25_023724 [Dendrobium thyrsiflorum]|uniref:Malectin-like domain-containing protein n=1 Tax=Dendrobium thyrsiflorum TaxID=117978 RepID=A0ABD0U003_DENTH
MPSVLLFILAPFFCSIGTKGTCSVLPFDQNQGRQSGVLMFDILWFAQLQDDRSLPLVRKLQEPEFHSFKASFNNLVVVSSSRSGSPSYFPFFVGFVHRKACVAENLLPEVGFVSIQCCAASNFTDQGTNLTWTSDNYIFHSVGKCENFSAFSGDDHKIACVFYESDSKSFCYYLPVIKSWKYLVRATFLNGHFPQFVTGSAFNFSIGSTSISQINSLLEYLELEGIFAINDDHTNFCLRNEHGNAYISKLELRPLNDAFYLQGSPATILNERFAQVSVFVLLKFFRGIRDLPPMVLILSPLCKIKSCLDSNTYFAGGSNTSAQCHGIIIAQSLKYCGIDPELEDKLDQMFLGVVATGDHAWTPNQGINNENVTADSENIDIGGDSFEDHLENLETIDPLEHPHLQEWIVIGIEPIDPDFDGIPTNILCDKRYMPYFKLVFNIFHSVYAMESSRQYGFIIPEDSMLCFLEVLKV